MHDYALSDDRPFDRISRHQKDLRQRKFIADTFNPKIFVSLHVNWSANKKRREPVVIYQVSDESFQLAQIVQNHLNDYYGMSKAPQKGTAYFLMKNLDMPSIIVELGYLSNAEDFQLLVQEHSQDQLVAAMVQAIEEYFLAFPFDNEA